jgi:hypothetical protein
MNTYFTFWHYSAVILITSALIALVVYTLMQPKLSTKFSIIVTYTLVAIGLLFGTLLVIDSYTKKITLSNVDNHRFLPTEEIIFTGSVRNSGNYTIGEISVEIKIVNKETAAQSGEPSYQSNAFAELLGDQGIKPSYLTVAEVVAINLKPGQSKNFMIIIPYPSYFKGFTDYVRAYGQ